MCECVSVCVCVFKSQIENKEQFDELIQGDLPVRTHMRKE